LFKVRPAMHNRTGNKSVTKFERTTTNKAKKNVSAIRHQGGNMERQKTNRHCTK